MRVRIIAALIGVAIQSSPLSAALASDCSDANMYASMGNFGLKDAKSYIDEQNMDMAKTEFDVLSHNLDVAEDSIGECDDTAILRLFAIADAHRWQMGHEQSWVTAETAGLRMHDDIRILHSIGEQTRDPLTYDALQVTAKSYYREAGIAWDSIK